MSNKGRLVLYIGPMFSGKSAQLIKVVQANPDSLILKPTFDTRDGSSLVSRNGLSVRAHAIREWPVSIRNFQNIILDEAQFMVPPCYIGDIVSELNQARNNGSSITIGALDYDYRRKPFDIVEQLKSIADEVIHLTALCHVCNKPALWTAKIYETGNLYETGDSELYAACCDKHWSLPREE